MLRKVSLFINLSLGIISDPGASLFTILKSSRAHDQTSFAKPFPITMEAVAFVFALSF